MNSITGATEQNKAKPKKLLSYFLGAFHEWLVMLPHQFRDGTKP